MQHLGRQKTSTKGLGTGLHGYSRRYGEKLCVSAREYHRKRSRERLYGWSTKKDSNDSGAADFEETKQSESEQSPKKSGVDESAVANKRIQETVSRFDGDSGRSFNERDQRVTKLDGYGYKLSPQAKKKPKDEDKGASNNGVDLQRYFLLPAEMVFQG